MTSIPIPPAPTITVHKGQLHRWRLLTGEEFLGLLVEVVPVGQTAVFEVDTDDGLRWLTLQGLSDWRLVG